MTQLCQLVAGILKVDASKVGPEAGPLTLPQWDSFHHVHIVVAVEESYGVDLSPDEIVSLLSVSDIADALRKKGVCLD